MADQVLDNALSHPGVLQLRHAGLAGAVEHQPVAVPEPGLQLPALKACGQKPLTHIKVRVPG